MVRDLWSYLNPSVLFWLQSGRERGLPPRHCQMRAKPTFSARPLQTPPLQGAEGSLRTGRWRSSLPFSPHWQQCGVGEVPSHPVPISFPLGLPNTTLEIGFVRLDTTWRGQALWLKICHSLSVKIPLTYFFTRHRTELFSGSVHCNAFLPQVFLVTKTTDLKYLSEAGRPFVIVNVHFYTRITDF